MGIFKISISPLRQRQFIGGLLGTLFGIGILLFFSADSSEEYISLGPMNSGHGELSCVVCHADAKGNLSQQIQTNVQHLLAMRKKGADFGTQDVTVTNCLQCHDRPNDRHPTFRFSEPRFSDAIKNINATTCITCHSEHRAERVTISRLDYCMNCHTDMAIQDDPLDVPHTILVENEQWSTCIQCHDFHGNHKYAVATKIKDTIPMSVIWAYAKGGKDPYGDNKKYRGLSETEWTKAMKAK